MSDIDTQNHPTELLPWYVNGSLEETERTEVERHLAGCQACRDEIALLAAVREEASAPVEIPPPELMYQRFRRSMNAQPTPKRSGLATYFAIAASLVILVQGVAIYSLSSSDSGYRLAGRQHEGIIYQVRFQDSADQASIRALLYGLNLRVIDGPSAMGLYTLQLPGRPDDAEAVLAQLNAHDELVAYVKRN